MLVLAGLVKLVTGAVLAGGWRSVAAVEAVGHVTAAEGGGSGRGRAKVLRTVAAVGRQRHDFALLLVVARLLDLMLRFRQLVLGQERLCRFIRRERVQLERWQGGRDVARRRWQVNIAGVVRLASEVVQLFNGVSNRLDQSLRDRRTVRDRLTGGSNRTGPGLQVSADAAVGDAQTRVGGNRWAVVGSAVQRGRWELDLWRGWWQGLHERWLVVAGGIRVGWGSAVRVRDEVGVNLELIFNELELLISTVKTQPTSKLFPLDSSNEP